MGLLDGALDNDLTRFGLGLLAASGPTNDPMKGAFGNRLMQAVGSFDDYRKQKMEMERAKKMQEFQDFQMQQARAQAEQLARRKLLAQQHATPAEPERRLAPLLGDSILPDSLKSGILPTQGTTIPAKPAGYNFEGYANALAADGDPLGAMEVHAKLQKDNSLTPVAPGASLFNPRTNKVVYTAPALPKEKNLDSKIEQYEYAVKNNGYKGTLEQFIAIAPTIIANSNAPLRTAQERNIYAENEYNLPQKQAAGISVTAGGKTYTFPTQAAANSFKMKAGIK